MIQDQKKESQESRCQFKTTTCCEVSKPVGLTTGSLLERDFNEWAGELRAVRLYPHETDICHDKVRFRFMQSDPRRPIPHVTYVVQLSPRIMEVTQGLGLKPSLSVANSSLVEKKILSVTEKYDLDQKMQL